MDDGPEPRWLDESERAAWLGLAHLSVQLPAALDAQLRRDAGISHFDYMILAWLSEGEDRTASMSCIADLTKASLSRLSHAFNRLEAHGWVTRAPDPTNGRVTLATLTDAGLAKVVDTAPGHVETVRELVFDSLTRTQVGQLDRIAHRITQAIGSQVGGGQDGGESTADT